MDDSLPKDLSSATTALDVSLDDSYQSQEDDGESEVASESPASTSSRAVLGKRKAIAKVRRQPGGALLKTEREKLSKLLSGLRQKRTQREKVHKGKAATSVCNILLDSLIEFYESVDDNFERKFGKYMENK